MGGRRGGKKKKEEKRERSRPEVEALEEILLNLRTRDERRRLPAPFQN